MAGTTPGPPGPDASWRPQTRAVRAGVNRSGFDETSEAVYLTSGYVFSSAAEAEEAFLGENDHYIYSRYTNPTVSMFEERLRSLEGAEACYATSSGMAATVQTRSMGSAAIRSGMFVMAKRGSISAV